MGPHHIRQGERDELREFDSPFGHHIAAVEQFDNLLPQPRDDLGEKFTAGLGPRQSPTLPRDPGTDGAANWFTFWLGPHPEQAAESRVFDLADDVSATISGTLAAQLPVAELFYVSDDLTELAGHAATTLTDYRLHPEDLPAQVGVMVYAHPPVGGTVTDQHDGITVVSWGPGRGGLWVHTWARPTSEWASGAARIGRVLAGLPHEEVLARAIRGSQQPPLDLEREPPTTEQAADDFAAGLLPNLRRAPIPPSFSSAHGYDWRGLTPMEFTDMRG